MSAQTLREAAEAFGRLLFDCHPITLVNPGPECIRTVDVTPLGGSQEQTMNTIDRLIHRSGRLDPGAVLRRWWRRLFRGARNGLPA